MSHCIVVPDLRDGYGAIAQQIVKMGSRVNPRGYSTIELEDVVVEIMDPSRLMPIGVGRGLNPAIGFGEALLLCGGLSSPSLLTNITGSFRRFMDGGDLHGSYGRRIRPQMEGVVHKLNDDSFSRQAIVTIWDPQYDQQSTRDTPCTLGFGFRIRDGELHMTSLMRSQDFWLGMAYDLFMFGQLGWSVARTLGINFGSIRHHVMSLHIYSRDEEKIDGLHAFDWEAAKSDENADKFVIDSLRSKHSEPSGIGAYTGARNYEYDVRSRAEKIYNRELLDDPTDSERIYVEMLHPYERLTRTENFSS